MKIFKNLSALSRLLPVFLAIVFSHSAAASLTCDETYQRRDQGIEIAYQALECFSQESPNLESYRKLMLSALWLSKAETSKDLKLKLYTEVLKRTEKEILEGNSEAYYWRAVFVTFECNELDGKSPLPTNILGRLASIKADLRKAMETTPLVHYSGPARILGIMYTSMPGIVGGSDKTALELLTQAHQAHPNFSQNTVWLSKVLIKLRKPDEAKALLNSLLNLDSKLVPQDWIPETKVDQLEAESILKNIDE